MNNKYMPNSTQTLNIVYDKLMSRLNGSEFKVVSFFIRQTYGFNQPDREVGYSLKQICEGIVVNGARVCEGTGLTKNTAIAAVKNLERYGILKIKTGSRTVANRYQLAFLDDDFDIDVVMKNTESNEDEEASGAKITPPEGSAKTEPQVAQKLHQDSDLGGAKIELSRNPEEFRNQEETQGETREIIRFQKMIFARLLPAFKNTLRVTDEMNLERVVRRELILKNLDVLSERLIDEFFAFRKKHGGVKLEHFNGRYNDFETFCANYRLKGGTKTTDDDDFFAYASEVGSEASA